MRTYVRMYVRMYECMHGFYEGNLTNLYSPSYVISSCSNISVCLNKRLNKDENKVLCMYIRT